MPTDLELLRQFAEQGDDAAFTEVVRRQTDFVYSTALRVTNNAALAEDVTQKVFLKMAERSGVLCHYTTLTGWLHTTTRHTALDAVRGEARRRTREQEASAMQNNPATHEPNWAELRPILDEAVGRLAERDRTAVLLRFFNGLSQRDVGATLGLSEEAARKRLDRSLEKMRGYFAKRGVTVSSALLAASISTNSVQAAPTGLAAQAARKSLAGKAAGAAAGTAGALTFLKILFMSTKNKIAIGVVVVFLIVIGLAIKFRFSPASPVPSVASTSSAPAAKLIVAPPASTPVAASTLPPIADTAPKPVVLIAKTAKPRVEPPLTTNMDGLDLQQAQPQIARAFQSYLSRNKAALTLVVQPGDSAHQAAYILSRAVYLNDASVYFITGDPYAPNPLPRTVMNGDSPNPAFANATLSVVIAGNLPADAPATTTPFLWTRGLQDDGTWASDSPFQGQGGFVTFLDGHTIYCNSLSMGTDGTHFIGYPNGPKAGQPTVNIREALPPGAVILSAEPNGKSN